MLNLTMKRMPTKRIAGVVGAIATVGLAQAADINVFTDGALTEFSNAGAYGTNIRVLKANQTWTNTNNYILTDRVFIPNGVTLRPFRLTPWGSANGSTAGARTAPPATR